MISSGTLRREGLFPAMDVVAIGQREQRVFYNPSEEPDSLVELLPGLVPAEHRRTRPVHQFVALLQDGMRLNAEQTGRGRAVAGFLDDLAVDLHDIELHRAEELGAVAGRAVAAAVRDPLRTLAGLDPEDLAAVFDAVRAVDRVLNTTPRAQALSPEVAYQLGERSFGLLSDLFGQRGATS